MNHVDLFSGIGGFALAAKWTGFETVVFCEKDEFCQKVLQKRFGAAIADSKHLRKLQSEGSKQNEREWIGNCPILIPEIRDFDGTKWRGATLLTGGFPCQPFSVAGKRKGKEDDRYLWPEMLRVIKEAKPRWILAENVAGIFRMALDTVLTDLESEGYTTGTVVIPAAGVNAPHRRDRIWIIAWNTEGNTGHSFKGISAREKSITGRSNNHAPDSEKWESRKPTEQEGGKDSGRGNIQDITNSNFQGLSGITGGQFSSISSETETFPRGKLSGADATREQWEIPWIEVATRFCRVDDGVPDRVDRLKSLGNAIVPQIAAEIMRGIAKIEGR